jgi:hypothetical protein
LGESADLEKMALARFGSLSEGEIRLLRAAPGGETAYCGPSQRGEDPGNNPADSDNWTAERRIRADLIRWLCIDRVAKDCVDPRGIQLCAARIIGALDLSFVTVSFPLRLFCCRLSDELKLNYIEIPSIDLTGTWVDSLSANHATVHGSVFLQYGFSAKGKVRLHSAKIGGHLSCDGGKFQNPANAGIPESGIALDAETIKVGGYVFLRNNFSAEGQVRLFGAQIGRNLECTDGNFRNPANAAIPGSGIALNAETIKVGGYVFLRNNFSAEGQVRLLGAEIGRNLECTAGSFQNPAIAGIPDSGMALNAEAIKVGGYVFLRNNFSAVGQVVLFGAKIERNLECDGGKFQNPAIAGIPDSGMALNAEAIKVGGAVLLRNNFWAEGQVRLFDAEVGGNLACDGGTFQNPVNAGIPASGMALNGEAIKVAGAILLRNNFSAEGQVRLFDAEVGGSLACDGGTFQNPVNAGLTDSGMALNGEGIKVGGSVLLRNNFSAEGQVRLFVAEIGGNLACDGGKFQNPAIAALPDSGMALNGEAIRVGGAVLFRNNFSAEGQVRLFGARIEGNFECRHAIFQNPAQVNAASSGVALDATGIKVEGRVVLSVDFHALGSVRLANAQITSSLQCDKAAFESVDLTDACVGLIIDDEESWPKAGMLALDGFVYGRIAGGPRDASKRLKWLERQTSFTRQPYRQLAKVLDEAGDDLGGRRVLSEMQRKAWKEQGWTARPLGYLLRATIGYGYFPLRAVWLLLTLVAAGTIVYHMGYTVGSIVPTQQESNSFFETHCYPPSYYERFHALAYSMENSFPLVKLGIQDKWAPAPGAKVAACLPDGTSRFNSTLTAPGLLRWFRWLQICFGWVLTTLFVGGVTGILRKN